MGLVAHPTPPPKGCSCLWCGMDDWERTSMRELGQRSPHPAIYEVFDTNTNDLFASGLTWPEVMDLWESRTRDPS